MVLSVFFLRSTGVIMCLDILIRADLLCSSYGSVSLVWGFYSLPSHDLCRASCPRERCTGAEFLPLVNYLPESGLKEAQEYRNPSANPSSLLNWFTSSSKYLDHSEFCWKKHVTEMFSVWKGKLNPWLSELQLFLTVDWTLFCKYSRKVLFTHSFTQVLGLFL